MNPRLRAGGQGAQDQERQVRKVFAQGFTGRSGVGAHYPN